MGQWFTGSSDVLFWCHNTLNLHFTDGNERSASGNDARATGRGSVAAVDTAMNAVALRKLFVTRLVESDRTREWRYAATLS
jgi:hypothetical protein